MTTRRSFLAVTTMAVGIVGCTSSSNRSERMEVVETYDRGIGEYQDARDHFNKAESEMESEAYSKAADEYINSRDPIGHSLEEFRSAADLAVQLDGYEEAVEICDTAVELAAEFQNAIQIGISLANAAEEGDWDRVERLGNEYRGSMTKLASMNVRDANTLASVLDLE